MRIRFFNIVEPVAPLYRDLLPFLAERGFLVEVIIGKTEYRPGRQPLEDVLLHQNIHIVRVGGGYKTGKGRLSKLGAMLTYGIGAASRTLLSEKADINFFLTQPPLYSLWGNVLRKLRGEIYICLVMDVYPDVAYQDGLIAERSLVGRLLRSMAGHILKNAAAIVVIGRCMQARIVSRGITPEKIWMIPNWVNEHEVFPVHHCENPLRRELGLTDEFVVLYSGNLGISHHFDDLLQVIQRCRNITKLKFVIIGDGVRRKEIERAKAANQLDNLLLLPFQSPDRLADSLSLGDVHFVSLKGGFEGLEVPSKAYGALAVGRALIYQGDSQGEIARMVTESQIGFVVQEGDVDNLEKIIRGYLNDSSLVRNHGERALELARTTYSSKSGLQRYKSLFVLEKARVRGTS
jgi:glycosyltransferase involved in cell wall biosynthesis